MHAKSNPGSVMGAASMKIANFTVEKADQKNNKTRNNLMTTSDDKGQILVGRNTA